MLVREMDPDPMTGDIEREIAIVATDIEESMAVPFAMFRMGDGTLSQTLTVRRDGVTVDATNPADSHALTTAGFNQVMASGFTSSGAGAVSYAFDDSGTADMDEAYETAGTYNGAPGTYRCTGTNECTVTYDADGMITAIDTDWIFTPDDGAQSDQPDYEFLHYGVWLSQTEDSDGAITYNEVEAFYGASAALEASTAGDLANLNGSASYTGSAVGLYVHDVLSEGGGSVVSSTSGHFSADVTLEANFAGGSIPAETHNMVTGSISNFVLSGGEDQDWAVNLDGMRADGANTFSGDAEGGGPDGSFNGTFYGDVTEDVEATPANESVFPSDVAGEFNANFRTGNVLGAFGANQDD